VPFAAKVNGRIGDYKLGAWPYEKKQGSNPTYANPKGFVEVTKDNLSVHLSEHFTLGQFITKDQISVWPKYVVLQPRLLDKLELTIAELRREGHPVSGLFVMSGFRTPEYNEQGVGAGGRSAVSRHQYGDAADVYPNDPAKGAWMILNVTARGLGCRILANAADAVDPLPSSSADRHLPRRAHGLRPSTLAAPARAGAEEPAKPDERAPPRRPSLFAAFSPTGPGESSKPSDKGFSDR
jgi:hypothetical protein